MSGPVEIVLIAAAVGYLMVRRMIGEPAQAKQMLILPAILSVVGLSTLSGDVKTAASLIFLVGTAAISIVLGVLRGASVRISRRDGIAFVRYTPVTVALWVANIVVKVGVNFALDAFDPQDAGGVSNSLLFTLGVGILAEGLVVLYRALRAGHQVMWAQGRDGAPGQTSPLLDNLQRNLAGRPAEWNTQSAHDAGQTRRNLVP
ncbi:DUF1453 domain-containing protein [Amycolatopsis sp. AA4]|uniref:DUF1453 family protein n=1 Tax=Actinomycetes TaxID=1760 RepID=UPI0001B544D2|nr:MULTISPECIES: DUF1453 family protein [Actinomycetes]ATY10024.1 DUF1453 domain-containing protein [Amycolatopsis sp. AA4]EFL05451.1 predicted protein [Streptomyces sp. AA4]